MTWMAGWLIDSYVLSARVRRICGGIWWLSPPFSSPVGTGEKADDGLQHCREDKWLKESPLTILVSFPCTTRPLREAGHWVLAVARKKNRNVVVFDSLGEAHQHRMEHIKEFCRRVSQKSKKVQQLKMDYFGHDKLRATTKGHTTAEC